MRAELLRRPRVQMVEYTMMSRVSAPGPSSFSPLVPRK